MEKLLTLPAAVQIALGSGYLAYLIAYAGLRERHTATDAIFRAIAFGLIATALLTWLNHNQVLVQIGAVMMTVGAGAIWRFVGMDWSRRILRHADISWTDDISTAWLTITATSTAEKVAQIAVDVEGGRTLVCDDTRAFADAPHGPCVFGLGGDVAMYVTAERRETGEWFQHEDVQHPTEGARLTYLPTNVIKRVELRYWTKSNEKAEVAALAAERAGGGGACGFAESGTKIGRCVVINCTHRFGRGGGGLGVGDSGRGGGVRGRAENSPLSRSCLLSCGIYQRFGRNVGRSDVVAGGETGFVEAPASFVPCGGAFGVMLFFSSTGSDLSSTYTSIVS